MKDYFTILPAIVRYDTKISPSAKILYSELNTLADEKGFCWASNGYFAKLFGVDKATVSRWVSQLRKAGYIFFKTIDENAMGDDNFINEYRQICIAPLDEKVKQNIKENNKKNNISRAGARSKNGSKEVTFDLDLYERMLNEK
jgi:hypothetical protein